VDVAAFHLFLGREEKWPEERDRKSFQDMVTRYMAFHNMSATDEKTISESMMWEHDRRHTLGKTVITHILSTDKRGWSTIFEMAFWIKELNAYIVDNGYSHVDNDIIMDAMTTTMKTKRYAKVFY
jgi:hypothetical protein